MPDLITKFTQIIKRPCGSEVRIVATAMFGLGLHQSVDIFVHKRENKNAPWQLCNDKPCQGWKSMSREDYIKHGRSEMLNTVSPGEIMKTIQMIGQPMSCLQ